MQIGPYHFDKPVMLAPMAGVTDRAFRTLCYQLGADLCVSEMVTSERHLWNSRKTRLRLDHAGEPGIRSVQIAGTDPHKMAHAARFNIDNGAQIIDINMGCPAKKVCNVLAGSALMKDEARVAAILESVVEAVDNKQRGDTAGTGKQVPVTLKIRTGWDADSRNAVSIARIAEDAGIAMLTVHGRTRADAYRGEAEYDTIAAVKAAVSIPVIANGDIDSAHKAATVLDCTGADGIMIGRAAQGNPWIFSQIRHFLQYNECKPAPSGSEVAGILCRHLQALYSLHGEHRGVRVARKHIAWYLKNRADKGGAEIERFRRHVNQIENHEEQLRSVAGFFDPDNQQLAA
jgi:tRNA-dihydrouridine synthase B